MLQLELLLVFSWRFTRTTVAAYVVSPPHVRRCQMTQVKPSSAESACCQVTQDKTS